MNPRGEPARFDPAESLLPSRPLRETSPQPLPVGGFARCRSGLAAGADDRRRPASVCALRVRSVGASNPHISRSREAAARRVPGSTPVPGVGRGVPPRRTSRSVPARADERRRWAAPVKVRFGGTPKPTLGTSVLPRSSSAAFFALSCPNSVWARPCPRNSVARCARPPTRGVPPPKRNFARHVIPKRSLGTRRKT